MKPKVIKTKADYEAAMARVEAIFDAKPGTSKGDELELLLLLVENYEEKAFPIELPTPVTAIRFRMDQQKLKAKDLIPFIGSKSKVSEVLNGQRELSLTMIRKLVKGLGIPAAVDTPAPCGRLPLPTPLHGGTRQGTVGRKGPGNRNDAAACFSPPPSESRRWTSAC